MKTLTHLVVALAASGILTATGIHSATASTELARQRTKLDHRYKPSPHTNPSRPRIGNQGSPKCFRVRTSNGYRVVCR